MHKAPKMAKAPKVRRHRRRKGHKGGRRRGGKRPFTFLKAWRKRRRGFKPFKTAKGKTFWQSPRAKYAEKAWYGQRKRHRRAALKGIRRGRRRPRRRRSRRSFSFSYEANPKRRRRARRYASNPVPKLGARLTGAKFYHLPGWGELKSQGPVKSILYGVGGLAATSLIGMGLEYGINKAIEKVDMPAEQKEYLVDAGRIFGKLALGSMVSWGMGKYVLKNNVAAKTWQAGAYISVGLDVAGTILKYVTRSTSQVKLGAPIRGPLNLGGYAVNVFGLGQLGNWWYENQIRDAIYKTGRVDVVGNEKGEIGVLHPGTGKVILAGPEKQMAGILGAIERAVVKAGYSEHGHGMDPVVPGLGEMISVEA
jgi:hypothetical protein